MELLIQHQTRSLRSALLENRYRPPWATDEVLTIKFDLPDNKKS